MVVIGCKLLALRVWRYVIELGIGRILRALTLVFVWPLETIRSYYLCDIAVRLNLKSLLLLVSFVAKFKEKAQLHSIMVNVIRKC